MTDRRDHDCQPCPCAVFDAITDELVGCIEAECDDGLSVMCDSGAVGFVDETEKEE